MAHPSRHPPSTPAGPNRQRGGIAPRRTLTACAQARKLSVEAACASRTYAERGLAALSEDHSNGEETRADAGAFASRPASIIPQRAQANSLA